MYDQYLAIISCLFVPILMIIVTYKIRKKRKKEKKIREYRRNTFKLIKGDKVDKDIHHRH